MEHSKYVVVGAGLAGAATAWSLARRGEEVTLLERTQPANLSGSSHGSARIFRYAYPDPFWVDLVVRARAAYTELEHISGRQLIIPTESLDFGQMRHPAKIAAALQTAGVDHELLSVEAARSRWPQIAVDSPVLWHSAGVIDAHFTVQAMVAAAAGNGASVALNWPVHRIEKSSTGYRVIAEDGRTVDADRIVVAAGGWLPDLLVRLPLPTAFRAALPRLEVRQENAFHFPYRDESMSWPTFIHKNEHIQTYSLPGGRDADFRGQKVAEYNGGRRLSSAAVQDGQVDPANQARVVEYVRKYLPGLDPEPYASTTCLFTNTPNEDFLIDEVEGITVLSPCSGHGAKFAPVVGDIAADLATGIGPPPDRFRAASIGAASIGAPSIGAASFPASSRTRN